MEINKIVLANVAGTLVAILIIFMGLFTGSLLNFILVIANFILLIIVLFELNLVGGNNA